MATKSVTRTIRLEELAIDSHLKELAEREGVSINFLINKALRKYIIWDLYAAKFGMVSIPSALLSRFMDMLTDEQARDLGKWAGENHVKDFVAFWFKEVNLQTLFKSYPRLSAQYGRMFQYEEYFDHGKWTFLLKHDMGAKWSMYYEEQLRGVFATVLHRDVDIFSTENQVIARFKIV